MYNYKILVIGEAMLDKYTQGVIKRLNPESPTQLVNKISEIYNLGGSANVCRNLSGLGAQVDFLSLINENDKSIANLCTKNNINLLPVYTKRKTTLKERITVSGHPLLRIDDEDKSDLTENEFQGIKTKIQDLGNKYDAIICSDYRKGMFSQNLCNLILKRFDNIKIADVKPENLSKFKCYDLVKTNFSEFQKYLEKEIPNENTLLETEFAKLDFNAYLLTRSEKGMSYLSSDLMIHHREKAKEVFDVTGAGDTVTASYVLEYLRTNNIQKSLEFANKCANVVISKHGCVAIKNEDLFT